MVRTINTARDEARARGDKRYFTRKACPRGHIGERFVISSSCCICADIARAERRIASTDKPKPVVHVISHKARREQSERVAAEACKQFSGGFVRKAPLGALLADYSHTVEARRRSDYLDSLVRNLTASKPKVPRHEEIT